MDFYPTGMLKILEQINPGNALQVGDVVRRWAGVRVVSGDGINLPSDVVLQFLQDRIRGRVVGITSWKAVRGGHRVNRTGVEPVTPVSRCFPCLGFPAQSRVRP